MPQPGTENTNRPPDPVEPQALNDSTSTASSSNTLAMLTQDLLRDRRTFEDIFKNNSASNMENLGFRNPELKQTQGSENPVQARDDKGRPTKLDWNGTPLKVEYLQDGKVSKIVNGGISGKTFLDSQSLPGGELSVDKRTGNISHSGAGGQKVEYNLKQGTKTSTNPDQTERRITDANGHKTTQTGDGKGNYTTTGFESKDGTKYKVDTDPFNDKEISSVSKLGANGNPEKTVEGGKLSFDKQGRLNQQVGDRTYVYDNNLNLIEAKGKDGSTVEKVGENGAKSLKLDKDGSLVADLGNNTFRATNKDGAQVKYTDTPDGQGNFERKLSKLDQSGKETGPTYKMSVDRDGNIQGRTVDRQEKDGSVTAVPVEKGKMVETRGDRKVTSDGHLNVQEVTDKEGTVAKVGKDGVKSISVDDKGNVVASLGDDKYRATDTSGRKIEYQEKAIAGKPGHYERNYGSGLSTTVEKSADGQEKILEAKRDGKTVAKVGENGVKDIKLDAKNNVVADLGEGKTRLSTPDGKKLEYQDKPIEGKPGQFERTFANPPGYSATVEKGQHGAERILEVKKDGETVARAGQKGVKSIENIDGEGRVTTKLNDGKSFGVIGADGKEAAKYTEKTTGDKTVRSYNPPSGVEVTMENGRATEVKFNTKDRQESWKVGQDGTATRQGGRGDLNKLEKASIDPKTGTLKGEATVKDGNGQPEKVQISLHPDGSRTETRQAKDKAGTSYEYKTTRDKDGHPIEVQHPILDNGKVVENSSRTIKMEYERDGNGKVVTKDGQPQLSKIGFVNRGPDGAEERSVATKLGDGKWQLQKTEMVYNYQTKKEEERPDNKFKPIVGKMDPHVSPDGTLKMKELDRSLTKISPNGDISRVRGEDLSKGPQTEAEKEAAKKRTEIVQVGTQADGKKTWGQGVPSVNSQWGFDGWGAEKGSFEPKTFQGDQGYSFSISQQVGKDENGQDIIQRRETKFNTENGVSIYYRDAEGSMKSLRNVTSMVSERQQDGTYKLTYHVKGENPGDSKAPQPVTLHTTADGRYVDQDGMAIGGKLDEPAKPRVQAHARNNTDNPQATIKGLEDQIRRTDTRTEQGKRQADDLAKQLIGEQMKTEDQKIGDALQKNNRQEQLEAERRKADLEHQANSEKERQQMIERIKKGQSAQSPERPKPAKPALPVVPDNFPLPIRPQPDCGPTG